MTGLHQYKLNARSLRGIIIIPDFPAQNSKTRCFSPVQLFSELIFIRFLGSTLFLFL